MKKQLLFIGFFLLSVVAVFALTTIQSGVTGKINPADGAEAVYVINDTDTAHGVITEGAFSIAAQPGVYTLHVKAKLPYKDAVLENVQIQEGQSTDVGEITLMQLDENE